MIEQLALGVDVGLCDYGTPKLGETRPCSKPATHAAVGYQPEDEYHREHTARVECCRSHADYYASAWVPIYPSQTCSAWIEILR